MSIRSWNFNDKLQNKYPFLKKVCSLNNWVKWSSCCGSKFSVAHVGRAYIKYHLKLIRL